MKILATAAVVTFISFPACAEKVAFGCQLVTQYSEDQVGYLLSEARSVIGDHETNRIYGHYVSLRSACQYDGGATRVVNVPPALRDLLAQNGVDIRRFAARRM
ncbi:MULTISPECIES: hypothetical protein [Methylosinus]|uniref:Uncharacterized protein n=1 Tax=Methylosinus sporium TaxID=428 RepID=A0A2U1SU20_METSR|nr:MULTISPECIES: hypothetical protein [Methylosinus]MBU3889544.1 hypothetical protein [Methylosinus sp. KRF6]PWB95106.1 hypothetical protein C5689_04780 [Methylosinus sporium]TRL36779.1 hypothetical protein FM996_03630 [Methylosinus sporium]